MLLVSSRTWEVVSKSRYFAHHNVHRRLKSSANHYKETKSSGSLSSSKYPNLWIQPLPIKFCLGVNGINTFVNSFGCGVKQQWMRSSLQASRSVFFFVPLGNVQTALRSPSQACSFIASSILVSIKYRFYIAYMLSYSLWYIFILLGCLGSVHPNYTNTKNAHWRIEKSSRYHGACWVNLSFDWDCLFGRK